MANASVSDSKLFAFLGVLLTVIGFIIVYLTKKDDKYAMFYAKQGLALFLVAVVLQVISWIVNMALFAGFFLAIIFNIVWVLWLIAWVFGMVFAFSGQMKDVPIIGSIAKMINV
jgi:uncharacterized membrane protein